QCAPRTHEARQPLRAAVSRNQAEVDLRLTDPRRIARDPQRTRHGKLASAAEREAIDGSDDRLAHVLDEIEDMLPGGGAVAAAGRRLLRELVDVGAGDEGTVASPGNDDAAQVA